MEPDRATWQSANRAFTQAFVTPPDTVQDSLYIALMYVHLGLAQQLLKHDADPNARDVDGQTLLSREGDWKVAKELMKLNVDMNSGDDQGPNTTSSVGER